MASLKEKTPIHRSSSTHDSPWLINVRNRLMYGADWVLDTTTVGIGSTCITSGARRAFSEGDPSNGRKSDAVLLIEVLRALGHSVIRRKNEAPLSVVFSLLVGIVS